MFCGDVCSTHKLWYTGLLKVGIAFICRQVLWGQTSTNTFALCYFWCNEPSLPSAVAAPSFPCQGIVSHVLPAGPADSGSWPTGVPSFPRLARAESTQLASLCRQAWGNKPAPSFSITSNKLYWVQLFCGFRPDSPTVSRCLELEQLEDGMWWDAISPLREGGMHPSLKLLHYSGFCMLFC